MLDSRQIAIISAARDCLGTPWQHQGRQPGLGLDCIGLLCHVAKSIGMPYQDQNGYGRIPRPSVLVPALDENLLAIARSEAMPGDVVLMRCPVRLQPMHVGILTDYGLIHAYVEVGRVVETVIDASISDHIIKYYRFKHV